jgi:hypothetical protein
MICIAAQFLLTTENGVMFTGNFIAAKIYCIIAGK